MLKTKHSRSAPRTSGVGAICQQFQIQNQLSAF
jgi:hypothetical protein